MTYYRAWENQRFVRGLLREKQPELAAALEAAVREPPCLRCDRSQCTQADQLTLPPPRAAQAPPGSCRSRGRHRAPRPARPRPEAAALANSVNVALYPKDSVERHIH
jgi:hypothetical protein